MWFAAGAEPPPYIYRMCFTAGTEPPPYVYPFIAPIIMPLTKYFCMNG